MCVRRGNKSIICIGIVGVVLVLGYTVFSGTLHAMLVSLGDILIEKPIRSMGLR